MGCAVTWWRSWNAWCNTGFDSILSFFLLYSILLRRERSLTIKPSSVLSVFRHLKGCTEAVVERGQVTSYWAGPPIWPLPDRGTRAWRVRDVSRMRSIRATWPNKVRQRVGTIFLNGCWEVGGRISTLVIWSNQQTSQMRLKHHWLNASFLSLSVWVTVQVSEA